MHRGDSTRGWWSGSTIPLRKKSQQRIFFAKNTPHTFLRINDSLAQWIKAVLEVSYYSILYCH